jgi:Rad3-related DNA helicase
VIDRFDVTLDSEIARHLCNIRDITLSISDVLPIIPVSPRDDERKTQVLTELKKTRDQAAELMYYENLYCWIESDKNENRLCSLPANLGDRLYNDIWKLGIPTILISGSLSVDGNLSYMKRLIGLDNAESFRVNEFVSVHP